MSMESKLKQCSVLRNQLETCHNSESLLEVYCVFGISHTESQLTCEILYKASRSLHCTHGRPTLFELYSRRKVGHFSDTLMICLVLTLSTVTCSCNETAKRPQEPLTLFRFLDLLSLSCSGCFNKADQTSKSTGPRFPCWGPFLESPENFSGPKSHS